MSTDPRAGNLQTLTVASSRRATADVASAAAAPGVLGTVPLGELLRFLFRRKVLLALGVTAGVALGLLAASLKPERFSAEGLLVIDTARLTIPELSPLASNRTVEPWGGRSEARILTTREIVAAAVDELRLIDHPAFNPTLAPPLLARLATAPWLTALGRDLVERYLPASARARRPAKGDAERAAIIDRLQRQLAASGEERSYAITLAFQGPTAASAAAVVNAVMQAYVARDRTAKQAALAEAKGELERRLGELSRELAEARLALGELEGQGGVLLGEAGTIRARALDALIGEAQSLRIERERVEADRARVEAALAGSAQVVLRGDLLTPRLEQLWAEEALLLRDLAEARQTLGPRHPQILELQAKADGIASNAAREVRSIGVGLEREAALLGEREARLELLIERAETAAANAATDRVEIELARQEVQSLQGLHDLYRERLAQTLVSPALVSPDARIVSLAEPPLRPDGPGRMTMGGLGGILGGLLVAGFVVGRRWLGDRLNGPDDVHRGTGLAVLGVLPTVGRRRRGLADAVASAPEGPVSESLRAILARLKAPFQRNATQILLVTSGVSGDGKTSFSLATARVAVREGLRCLVVEGDCKRPGLRQALGPAAKAATGLPGDEAPGGRQLPYSIVTDQAGGAHVLVAQPLAELAPSLLRSERLRLLFANARTYYDLIIIDGPPLLATADSLLLAEHADAAILVAAVGRTDTPGLATAAGRLAQTGCPIAGVVLNRCPGRPPRHHAFSGYGGPVAARRPAA